MNSLQTSNVDHIYIIDNDPVSRYITERLIKNECGRISLQSFDSCELALHVIQLQEQFHQKEYPQLIILGSELNEECSNRFLAALQQLKLTSLVYVMRDAEIDRFQSGPDNVAMIQGYLSKPVRRRSLSAIFDSYNQRVAGSTSA